MAKGEQVAMPGMPARVSDRQDVEDRLNDTIACISAHERQLREAKRRERLLREQLASLPREG